MTLEYQMSEFNKKFSTCGKFFTFWEDSKLETLFTFFTTTANVK